MQQIVVNGIHINYQEEGVGFPLVLIHGLSDDSTLWAPLIPEFSKHFRTIALDVRGHGYSSKPDAPYSIKLLTEDLFEFLGKLKVSQTHLLGLSMGGAIAQQFALDHMERVHSLILLSTFHYVSIDLDDTFQDLRNCLIEDGFSSFFDKAVRLVVTPKFVSANVDAIAEIRIRSIQTNCPTAIIHALDACRDFNIRNRISQISLPTLIISGEEDVFTPPQLSEEIHKLIKGSKWKVMSDVGHNLIIPEKTQELAQIVREFLECR